MTTLSDIVDFHVHSAPSLAPRHATDPEMAQIVRASGVSRFVLKAHEGSSAERASLLGDGAVGGVVLNSPVGGANPDAVAVAARLGGRVVWMPTISAPAHLAGRHDPELGAHRDIQFREVQVCERSKPLPAWLDVFDVIAAHDLVLASGHLTLDETIACFTAARARGVKRLLVNHPFFPFMGWQESHALALRSLDAHIEVGVLADILTAPYGRRTEDLLAVYPASLLVFGSDLGHVDYPTYQDGLSSWLARIEGALDREGLELIMAKNGRALLGV